MTRRSLAGYLIVAGCLVLFGGAASTLAADPSGSPAPSAEPSGPPGGERNIEIWLDESLPPDVPVGRTVGIALTVWDRTAGELGDVTGATVRVHPKTGKAKPTEARTRSDWPGHLVADISIPKGGLGAIEVGFRAQECHDDTGTCTELFVPFAYGGVGPPPEAPRSLLVVAGIHPVVGPVHAGQPIDLTVDIVPRAQWDPAALALPDRLIAIAMTLRGQDLATSELKSASGPAGPFAGSITIPDDGDAVLVVGFPGNGGRDDVIDRAALRLKVLASEADSGPDPVAAGTTAAADSLPIVPIALIAVALVALGLVIRRGFADL